MHTDPDTESPSYQPTRTRPGYPFSSTRVSRTGSDKTRLHRLPLPLTRLFVEDLFTDDRC
ncbi:hypothetical protein HanXRQr2_Chr11g0479501 [Helianthus annuus]|uniref:Uncharacterized protein n=1 Tax=Helianthus annuus TaxID=4232 RepID=A0A9K3HMF6_HELAN|nr:hypothetical protein HanXRQr2_Chr11g0479501 [Helianthus annuus]